jgi:hypothetical protein
MEQAVSWRDGSLRLFYLLSQSSNKELLKNVVLRGRNWSLLEDEMVGRPGYALVQWRKKPSLLLNSREVRLHAGDTRRANEPSSKPPVAEIDPPQSRHARHMLFRRTRHDSNA